MISSNQNKAAVKNHTSQSQSQKKKRPFTIFNPKGAHNPLKFKNTREAQKKNENKLRIIELYMETIIMLHSKPRQHTKLKRSFEGYA